VQQPPTPYLGSSVLLRSNNELALYTLTDTQESSQALNWTPIVYSDTLTALAVEAELVNRSIATTPMRSFMLKNNMDVSFYTSSPDANIDPNEMIRGHTRALAREILALGFWGVVTTVQVTGKGVLTVSRPFNAETP